MCPGRCPVTIFDTIVFAIVGLSAIVGLVRGAIREVIGLSSWLLAFIAAKTLSPKIAPLLLSGIGSHSLAALAAFVGVFVVTLLVVSLLGALLTAALKRIGLGPVNRVFGLVVGVLRGVLIVLIGVVLAGMTGMPATADWRAASTSRLFEALATGLKPWLPDGVARRLNFDHTRV